MTSPIPSDLPAPNPEEPDPRRVWWDENVPFPYQKIRLKSFSAGVQAIVNKWIEEGMAEHQNLVIFGPTGVGKTALMWSVVRELLVEDIYSRVVNVPSWLESMRGDGKHDVSGLMNSPILCLDDFGAESPSVWTRERLYLVLNHRFERGALTIATTNVPLDVWDTRQEDARNTSRLFGGAHLVLLTGKDRRSNG